MTKVESKIPLHWECAGGWEVKKVNHSIKDGQRERLIKSVGAYVSFTVHVISKKANSNHRSFDQSTHHISYFLFV